MPLDASGHPGHHTYCTTSCIVTRCRDSIFNGQQQHTSLARRGGSCEPNQLPLSHRRQLSTVDSESVSPQNTSTADEGYRELSPGGCGKGHGRQH